VFELWYQQKLFGDTLRIKAGKVDANSEFSVIDNGLSFINSSTQVTPTLFVFPTTPDPMPGINLFYTPKGPFYASFGVFDANRGDHFLNFYGHPESIQPTLHGKLLIGETGLTWTRAAFHADGNLRLGFWGHTGTFTRFDGAAQRGAQGLYLILDQTLWKPTPGGKSGLRTFLEYAQTDRAVTTIYRHFGGGLTWTGLLPGRRQDTVGFSPQYARLSPQAGLPHHAELALEMFYRVKVTPWATVQSDWQYIVHPGGQYPSALVAALRFKLAF
jgi:porin